MTQDPRYNRHLRLVARMADALGVDLEHEKYFGRLRPGELDEMVARCAGCTETGDCERRLSAPGARLSEPLARCRNATKFRSMNS